MSSNCSAADLRDALFTANKTVTYAGQREQEAENRHAVTFRNRSKILLYDESCSPPIFNYARVFSWSVCVSEVENTFASAAAGHAARGIAVIPSLEWQMNREAHDPRDVHQIRNYHISSEKARNTWRLDIISRMIIASSLALGLQWCTVGASTFVKWYTPAIGLGCRSGSYLLYGLGSTIVWFLLVLSTILGHLSFPKLGVQSQTWVAKLAIVLNTCGKILAALNAAWIICLCLLHFTNVYSTCFCDASVIGRGVNRGYVQLVQTQQGFLYLTHLWISGVCVSSLVAASFVMLVWLYQRSSNRLLC